jgi:cellulose synthase/poly-beta-1,6-N-acetylglucosamine synthase-like glycosyltransferase
LRRRGWEILPIYTILIPFYHEAKILSHIIENVYKIDYPHEKLDVKILMEEKDTETINEAKRLGLFAGDSSSTSS